VEAVRSISSVVEQNNIFCTYLEPSKFDEDMHWMLAFKSLSSSNLFGGYATSRKNIVFLRLALNSYYIL
jgi:hypothetical protein